MSSSDNKLKFCAEKNDVRRPRQESSVPITFARCTKFLKNPDCLPVEQLAVTITDDGVVKIVKALDKYWVENRRLSIYERPPDKPVMGAVDAWLTRMTCYLDDLRWLLSLEYHKFWSTVLYADTCTDCLVSFLQEARPPHLPPYPPGPVHDLYRDIRRALLVVYCRLATNKESETEWMSKEHLGKVMYEHYIFSVPVLWDLCAVYGLDNATTVRRLLRSVFMLQPAYLADLHAALRFVQETFKFISMQVDRSYDRSRTPPNLPETFKGFSEIRRPEGDGDTTDKLNLPALRDLALHLLDSALTIRIFIENYPESVPVFKKVNFVLSIVQLYESGIPALYERLEEIAADSGSGADPALVEVTGYVDATRVQLVDIFREILAASSNAILCSQSGGGSVEEHVAEYLETLMEGLTERLLMRDYHACYPVQDDLDMLRQAYPDIDSVKIDFILQAVYSSLDDEPSQLQSQTQPQLTNGHLETASHSNSQLEPDTIPDTRPEIDIPDSIKEESLISEVKDILPHLGDGFILKCLKFYGFNSERVINSVLEGSLDDSLKSLDRNLPIIPEDPLDKKFLETGIERLNVFDGDEFDIMTRDDVDLSRIHVGKRQPKFKDLKEMLNDKSSVRQMKDLYNKYSLVADEDNMYSDEYDDTYDGEGDSAAPEPEPAGDERRPIVVPRVLRTQARDTHESSDEEEEAEAGDDQGAAGSSRSNLDFCVNPEVLRARREAARARGRGQRPHRGGAGGAGRGAGRGTGSGGTAGVGGDVVGRARGQGQERGTVVARERKGEHKASRANHNRRSAAAWKRQQPL